MKNKTAIDNDLNIEEIYEDIVADLSVAEEARADGIQVTLETGCFSDTLYLIECFVREIEATDEVAYSINVYNGVEFVLEQGAIARNLININAFIDEFSDAKIYSPHVTAFFDAAKAMNIMQMQFSGKPTAYCPDRGVPEAHVLNELISKIRKITDSAMFKRTVYSREYNCDRGFDSTKQYIDALFDEYARLLVLRIDLGFKRNQEGSGVGLSSAQEYLSKFLNSRRSNKIFKDEVGYIWKLEFGKTKGYHFHVILFLDGSLAHKDEFRASVIGRYWEHITGGKGYHYNCNLVKRNYDRIGLGIGMIHHSDIEMRKNLLRIVRYFFKKEQFIKEKFTAKTRVFSRGEMPKSRRFRSGRPRKEPQQISANMMRGDTLGSAVA
jgi:hypothetical protein